MIVFRGKEIEPKQLNYMIAVSLNEKTVEEQIRILLSHSLGLTDVEIDSLTLEEGMALQVAANAVNDVGKSPSQPQSE